MLIGKQTISLGHVAGSASLAGASLVMTGEIIRDLAALASLSVSVVALWPVVSATVRSFLARLRK